MAAGKETFRRAILEMRNRHIPAAMASLITFRQEVMSNDEFRDRGGTDDPTRDHFKQLLINCDRWRRMVTHNPENKDLGAQIAKAIDPNATIDIGDNPFGGDDVQNQSTGLFDLSIYFQLDGSNPDIPLPSQLKFRNANGTLLLGAIDGAIVTWTRLNSRDRSRFITVEDSMRIYGKYQEILGLIEQFMGDDNRVDVAQVLPSDEPLGPGDSPNMRSEAPNHTEGAAG